MEKKYALITGATGGLGKAFVDEVAKEGYSLLLTGRSEE
jgi:short-subunit dehydrogenase